MLTSLSSVNGKRRYKTAYVEALQDEVRVRSLTGGELIECQEAFSRSRKAGVLLTIQKSVCDENGDAWINDEEVGKLSSADGAVIDALFELCNAISGNHQRFDDVVEDKKKDCEPAAFDSSAT